MPEFRFPVHPLLFQFPVFLRKEVLHFLLLLWKAHPLPVGKEFPFLPPEGVQLFLFLFVLLFLLNFLSQQQGCRILPGPREYNRYLLKNQQSPPSLYKQKL